MVKIEIMYAVESSSSQQTLIEIRKWTVLYCVEKRKENPQLEFFWTILPGCYIHIPLNFHENVPFNLVLESHLSTVFLSTGIMAAVHS